MSKQQWWFRVEPISRLDRIRICDNGEPLVHLAEACKELLLAPRPGRPETRYARATVAQMLNRAQSFLPPGHRLLVFDAYRSAAGQQLLYERITARLRAEHPDWPLAVLRREANRYVHPPHAKTPPPHSTGGAVDLTIVGPDGRPLGMIAPFRDPENDTAVGMGLLQDRPTSPYAYFPDLAHTNSPRINEIARRNRKILIDAMTAAGFTNYPGEWWHWSYGDSGWALRTDRDTAIYGQVEEASLHLQALRGS